MEHSKNYSGLGGQLQILKNIPAPNLTKFKQEFEMNNTVQHIKENIQVPSVESQKKLNLHMIKKHSMTIAQPTKCVSVNHPT